MVLALGFGYGGSVDDHDEAEPPGSGQPLVWHCTTNPC